MITRVPQVLRNVAVDGADGARPRRRLLEPGARRRRRARRRRPGARAPVGHRAAGAGDGGSDRPRGGRGRGASGSSSWWSTRRPVPPRLVCRISPHVWDRRRRPPARDAPGARRRRPGPRARPRPRGVRRARRTRRRRRWLATVVERLHAVAARSRRSTPRSAAFPASGRSSAVRRPRSSSPTGSSS